MLRWVLTGTYKQTREFCYFYDIPDNMDWSTFWKNEKGRFDEIMKINTAFFATRFIEKFSLKASSRILDFGCGPGLLEDQLVLKTQKITGVDINSRYIEECRRRHPYFRFHIITSDADYENHLGDAKFDFIILLSVAQYFKDENQLEEIISKLKVHLSENGKLIVSDVIDERSSNIRDLIALTIQALKKGKLIALIKFVTYLLFSQYRKTSARQKLLQIDLRVAQAIAIKNGLVLEEISDLTIHVTRKNYIFMKSVAPTHNEKTYE